MPTFSADDDLRRPDDSLILVEATLPDWPPLGGSVSLALTPRCTVLVGKNATGKSLLLEGLALASGASENRNRDETAPRRAQFTFQSPGGDRFHFEYNASEPSPDSDRSSQTPSASSAWTERCWREGEGEDLWHASQGLLWLRGADQPLVRSGATVATLGGGPAELPPEMNWLLGFLKRVKLVKAGIPRSSYMVVFGTRDDRSPLVLTRTAAKPSHLREPWHGGYGSPRLIELATTLLRWYQSARARFDELVELIRQVEVIQKDFHVDIKTDPYGGEVAQIFLDGVNLGLLSDGILRTLEILTALVGTATLVLIEEPETGIYPGLLDRLLAIVESYSTDRQLVLSTHSPQVVSWADPADLRLIVRAQERTQVRSLSRSEVERVDAFLLDQGTLGDFIYSGAVDD